MSSPTSREHRARAGRSGPATVAIVTVSDSRTRETDASGAFLRDGVVAAGHRLGEYRIVRDEPGEIARALRELVEGEADLVLFNGGTGISRRDRTYDVLRGSLDTEIPGFGELFRMLSFAEIGSAAMLSRATAGLHRGRVVFSLPGSPAAVRLAWERLIEPEIQHLAWEASR